MLIDFEDLYISSNVPRVHGNGFIQLDIPGSPGHRINIWPEQKLQTQKVYTGIHNHKFSFKSKVLLGTLIHKQFENIVLDDNGDCNIYKAAPRDNEDTQLVLASSHLFKLTNPQTFKMTAGSEYEFLAGKFHDSNGCGLTATLMEKTSIDKSIDVIVVCPKDKEPDNDFNRYQFGEKVLWPIIENAFKQIKEISI